RPPNEQELKATLVVELPLREVVAKVRTGGPIDDGDDMGLPVWAGVVPLRLVAGAPDPASDLTGNPVAAALAWPPEPGRMHAEPRIPFRPAWPAARGGGSWCPEPALPSLRRPTRIRAGRGTREVRCDRRLRAGRPRFRRRRHAGSRPA